jgi:hypothetical protein
MATRPSFRVAHLAKLSAAGGTAKEQSGESRSAGLRLLRVARQCLGVRAQGSVPWANQGAHALPCRSTAQARLIDVNYSCTPCCLTS